jgi:hypothetical protein
MALTPFEKRRAAFEASQSEAIRRSNDLEAAEFARTLARIERQVTDPEYQRRRAMKQMEQQHEAERERRVNYDRQLSRLSRHHVREVRRYTDSALMPLHPGPELLRWLSCEWDWSSSVFLVGPTGSAKTTAMTWAAMHWACDGGDVQHVTALQICRANGDELRALQRADLLLLDQVHLIDGMPDWQVGPAIELIDHRFQADDVTIAAGTAEPDAMGGIIGAEVRRRFSHGRSTNETWDPKAMGSWPLGTNETSYRR